jgi:hypothetical protein
VTDRETLEAALALDENDAVARMALCDVLEEEGDEEELARQRAWPAAKMWLVNFCGDKYGRLMRGAGDAAKAHAAGDVWGAYINCGSDESLMWELKSQSGEFWRNWSVVAGVPLPDGLAEAALFSCSC